MSRLAALAWLALLMTLAPGNARAQDAWALVDGSHLVDVPSGKRIQVASGSLRALDIARNLDGSLLVLRRDGVHRLGAGGKLTLVASLQGHKRQDHLAVFPDGRYVVTRYDSFAIWDGKTWSATTRESISDSVRAIKAVFLASGQLWVVTARKVFRRQGGRWIGMEPGYHGTPAHVFPAGAMGASGQILVPHINALTFWQPKPSAKPGFDKVDLSAFASKTVQIASFSLVCPMPDGGALLYGVMPCQFVVVPKAGKPWSFSPVRAKPESCKPFVRDMAVDKKGRMWAATQTGLYVYSEDGKPGNSAKPLVEGNIEAVVLDIGPQ